MTETSHGTFWTMRVEALLQKLVNQNETLIVALKQLVGPEDSQLTALMEQVIVLLTPAPPPTPGPAVAFRITVEEEKMANAKSGKIKLDVLGNGTAQGTITGIVDVSGLATTFEAGTVPAWTSSDPGVVATAAADGMSAVVAPAAPPVLVTGATLTVTASQPTQGVITATYTPVNIVAGAAGAFVVSVQ
jgi:hypothetical protein